MECHKFGRGHCDRAMWGEVGHYYRAASQVSDKFLNGHSNEMLEVAGVSIQKSPAPQLAKAALLMAAED